MHLGVLENLLTAAAVSLSDFQSMATNKSSEEFQPSEVVLFNRLRPLHLPQWICQLQGGRICRRCPISGAGCVAKEPVMPSALFANCQLPKKLGVFPIAPASPSSTYFPVTKDDSNKVLEEMPASGRNHDKIKPMLGIQKPQLLFFCLLYSPLRKRCD